MNQKSYEMKTLLNVAAATAAATGTYVDLAPSASVAKREMKVVAISNGNTYTTATLTSFPIVLEECDTTAGTYSTIAGDTVTTVGTAAAVTEHHVQVQKRYVRARIGTPGTGGTSANIVVLMQNLKREA